MRNECFSKFVTLSETGEDGIITIEMPWNTAFTDRHSRMGSIPLCIQDCRVQISTRKQATLRFLWLCLAPTGNSRGMPKSHGRTTSFYILSGSVFTKYRTTGIM